MSQVQNIKKSKYYILEIFQVVIQKHKLSLPRKILANIKFQSYISFSKTNLLKSYQVSVNIEL